MSTQAKCNANRLVMQSGFGTIRNPFLRQVAWMPDCNGKAVILPRMGGITYNVKIGDSVYSMEGDHIEPGVTISNPIADENTALNILSCIGNEAKVITGDAKGEKGFVTGKHGGVDHVLVYFPRETLEKLTADDKIQIRMQGRGMKVEGFEDTVHCIGIDPALFDKIGITVENGKLIVPVAAKVPAYLMGSGMGESTAMAGDYDIMTADCGEALRYGLDKLRYGDIVLLEDCDNTYGRGYLKGAVSVGFVVHGSCILMGHGPGVSTIFSAKTSIIEGRYSAKANLADIMGV